MTVRKQPPLPFNVASFICSSPALRCAVLLYMALAVCFPRTTTWRPATEEELKNIIPARAPVEKERIETEFRTASGVIGPNGKYLAGVVLITAGYSAEGKYSHFVTTGVPVKIGNFSLRPGEYVFGSRHDGDGLAVKFYEAQSGRYVGTVDATRQSRIGKIESFHIAPSGDHGIIEIGRFGFVYQVSQP
jgi:hypothetical protein